MTARDFCFWLQGYFEILGVSKVTPDAAFALKSLNPEQVDVVRRHLSLVFAHDIDPKVGGAEAQAKLNAIHGEGFEKVPDTLPFSAHHVTKDGSRPRC